MRAGLMDRVIEIQTPLAAVDDYGTPVTTWTKLATMRAQVLQYDTSNREGQHVTSDTTITFRMYWMDGLSLEHRVLYDGQALKIGKIKEIGRRVGLDLIVERVGP
jgi:SPP1 family predicted phage head-tail adaptor